MLAARALGLGLGDFWDATLPEILLLIDAANDAASATGRSGPMTEAEAESLLEWALSDD